jgi:hypothetical protein
MYRYRYRYRYGTLHLGTVPMLYLSNAGGLYFLLDLDVVLRPFQLLFVFFENLCLVPAMFFLTKSIGPIAITRPIIFIFCNVHYTTSQYFPGYVNRYCSLSKNCSVLLFCPETGTHSCVLCMNFVIAKNIVSAFFIVFNSVCPLEDLYYETPWRPPHPPT